MQRSQCIERVSTIMQIFLVTMVGLVTTATPAWAQSTLEYALLCAANPSACPPKLGGTCQKIVSAEFVGTVCSGSSQQSFRGYAFLTDGGLLDTTTSGDTIQTYALSDGSTYHFKRGLLKTTTYTGRIYQVESITRSLLNGAFSTSSEMILNGVEQLPSGGTLDTTNAGAGYYVRRYMNPDGSGRYIRYGPMKTPTFEGVINQTDAREKAVNGTSATWSDTVLNGVEILPTGGTLDTRNAAAGHYVRNYVQTDGSGRYIRFGYMRSPAFQGILNQTEFKDRVNGTFLTSSDTTMNGVEQLPDGGMLDTSDIASGHHVRRLIEKDGTEWYIKNGVLKTPSFDGVLNEATLKYQSNGVWQTSGYITQTGTWRISPSQRLTGTLTRAEHSGKVNVTDIRKLLP